MNLEAISANLTDLLEQILMEKKQPFFTYNRGHEIDSNITTQSIELKTKEKNILLAFIYDHDQQNLVFKLLRQTGEITPNEVALIENIVSQNLSKFKELFHS